MTAVGEKRAIKENSVCIVTTVHSPFDTRIFHKEAKTLVKAGYDVTLIVQHDRDEVVDGVKIIPLSKPGNRFTRIFGLTWRAFRLALRQKANIYHFHDPELLLVGVALKLLTKGKVIYDVHEHYPNAIMSKYWIPKPTRLIVSGIFRLQEFLLVPLLDAVIYTTPIVGERYKRMRVQSVRVENLPLLEMFEGIDAVGHKANSNVMIYSGGMARIRGVIELIEAFAIVKGKHPDLSLYLVGGFSPKSFGESIRSLIIKLGIKEEVKLIPPVPYDKVKNYLSRASIGIVTYLPYPNNMSCLPNKLFEYMACGLPIVASDFPLYREVIEDADCGKLVDPRNPMDIASAIEELLENPEEWETMSQNGCSSFRNKYNWHGEEKKLLDLYEQLTDF